MFNELYRGIFCRLVTEDGAGGYRLNYSSLDPITWDSSIELKDSQFTNYQRLSTYNSELGAL